MTSSGQVHRISVLWLLLDLLGMVLMGLGFAVLFGKTRVFPASWQLPGEGTLLIVTGLVLMLPLYAKVWRAVRTIRRQDQALLDSLPEHLKPASLRKQPDSRR
jgi:hypothetical protein